jgi:hypothetical protein
VIVEHLEDILHRYRPAGPPPELRDRVVVPPPRWREWIYPIAAAAAAMTFYVLTDSTHRHLVSATSTADADLERAIADLTVDLGGDDTGRLMAERLIRGIESAGVDPQAQGIAAIEEMIP